MRGSKYELKFDYQGKPVNFDEMRIREVLKKGNDDNPGAAGLIGLGTGVATADINNQSNSNMSH